MLHNSVLFISFWLLWVFIALPGLCWVAAGRKRVLWAVRASLCSGFSCCGARALERVKVCAQLLSHIQLFPNPVDCSLPGSSVHGLFQARNTGVGAISSSSGSSWPRDQPCVSCIGRQILHPEPPGPAMKTPGCVGSSNCGTVGSVVVAWRLGFPAAHGIFLGRGGTRVPRIGRRILNHWTTREVLGLLLYRICHRLGFVLSLSYVLFIHSSLKPYEIGSVMIPNLRIRTMSQSDGPAHRHNS